MASEADLFSSAQVDFVLFIVTNQSGSPRDRSALRKLGLLMITSCNVLSKRGQRFERCTVARNLMLTTSGKVKVLDLGLARLLNQSVEGGQVTSRGQFLGTLDYVAPEQCEDSHEVDIRADIYSLGCTLYHLLAGHPPFAAPPYSSVFQKLKAHAEALAAPIREHRPEIPEALASALKRMLAKDRKDRFASPADVVATLQPISARADLVGLFPAKPPSAALAA